MANIIKPTVSDLFYCVVDDNGNKIISMQLLSPPATLVDNSDDLVTMTGILRGNEVSMTNYWVINSVDPNGYLVPGYVPREVWEDEKTADRIDTIFQIDLLYWTENPPTDNFTIDLSDPTNDAPHDGGNNQYLLLLIQLFASYDLVYTALITE